MYSINRSAWTVPGQCDHVGLVVQYWKAAIEKLWSRDEKDAVLQLAFSKSLRRPELDAQLTGLWSVGTEDMTECVSVPAMRCSSSRKLLIQRMLSYRSSELGT